jgi:hypothetical protein
MTNSALPVPGTDDAGGISARFEQIGRVIVAVDELKLAYVDVIGRADVSRAAVADVAAGRI